jgi:superfamily II DNA or RNA helicase
MSSNSIAQNVTLRAYQETAKNQALDFLNIATRQYDYRNLLLHGPTAMGKTYTASAIIAEHMERYPNTAFVWLTPANGGLDRQSYETLTKHLTPYGFSVFDSTDIATGQAITKGSVTVLNWSQVDKDNNIATRDTEGANIFTCAAESAHSHLDLIVIVDESHRAFGVGQKAIQFIGRLTEELRYSPTVIELSATPRAVTRPKSTATFSNPIDEIVKVKVEDVRNAGVIANGVYINRDLDLFQARYPLATKSELVMHAGLESIKMYQAGLLAVGATWKPLLGVQIPNGESGVKYLEEVKEICEGAGVTVDNGKLAIHLTGTKENLKGIKESDSTVEVLVFKTAVATGWDCPRAKGLVAYRESESNIFKVQTIGRFLRMPELKHYGDDNLDYAFIYTTLDSAHFDYSKSGMGSDYFTDTYTVPASSLSLPTTLPTAHWQRNGSMQGGISEKMLAKGLRQQASIDALKAVEPIVDSLEVPDAIDDSVVFNQDMHVDEIFNENHSTAGMTLDVRTSEVTLESRFTSSLADIMCEPYTNIARSYKKVLNQYIDWYGSIKTDVSESRAKREAIKAFIASPDIRDAWREVIHVCAGLEPPFAPVMEPWKDYVFPQQLDGSSGNADFSPVSTHVGDLNDSYLYKDENGVGWLSGSVSKPEAKFMREVLRQLKNKGNLVWWWKNPNSGQNVYQLPLVRYQPVSYNFNPDYLICVLDSNGNERLLVLEVKDGATGGQLNAFSTNSRLKAEALGHWLPNSDDSQYVGGVVYKDALLDWKFASQLDRALDRPLFEVICGL